MARKKAAVATTEDAFRLLAERLKNPAAARSLYTYEPHKKQEKFHRTKTKGRLYIGGNRAGKTVAGTIEDIWYLTGKHPHRKTPTGVVRGRVVAVDFIQGIQKIILPVFGEWLPPSMLQNGSWEDSYNRQERTLTLDNGSWVEFMSYDQDLEKFAGTSRHFTHFDEEPPQAIFNECMMRLIDTDGDFWITMTPVEGMTWVYDGPYNEGKGTPNISVIEVDMMENPHLSQSAIDVLSAGFDDDEKQARLHGKFVQLGGKIYPMYSPEIHVIPPIDLSLIMRWPWYVSMDHGFRNPSAFYWHAVDPVTGNVVTFDEHYNAGNTVDYHAALVHAKDRSHGKKPIMYIGDPSIQQHNGVTGTSIHSEYARLGIPIVLANNDVASGVNRVASYLRAQKWHITANCVNLQSEMLRYRWKIWANKKIASMNNLHEVPHKKDDHAMDSIRYLFMNLPPLEDKDIHDSIALASRNVNASHAVSTDSSSMYFDRDASAFNERASRLDSWEYSNIEDEVMGGEW